MCLYIFLIYYSFSENILDVTLEKMFLLPKTDWTETEVYLIYSFIGGAFISNSFVGTDRQE